MAKKTLNDAIAFNNAHANEEMPYFTQDIWDLIATMPTGVDDPQPAFGNMTYNQALAIDQASGVNGIDAALRQFHLDAVVSATDNPAWATDLLYGTTLFMGRRAWRLRKVIRSCRCRQGCLRCSAGRELFRNCIQRAYADKVGVRV